MAMAGMSHDVHSTLEWNSDPSPVMTSNSRNITRFLNEGDWFKVAISPPQDWSDTMEPPTEGTYAVPFKPALVNITDSFGNQTELLCDFLRFSDDPTQALVFYNVSGTGEHGKIEAHGIDRVMFEIPVGSNKPGIVAKALSNGNYTVDVWLVVGGGSDPFTMKITKGTMTTPTTVEYSFLGIPVSLVSAWVLVAGVVLLVYGFGTGKKERAKKRVH
jgi:hypothetical protein